MVGDSILQIKELTVKFGGLTAVNNVDIDVLRNEFFGIIGPNGAGKTTVFNLVTGATLPASGNIIFNEQSIVGKRPDQIARYGISRTFQNIRLFTQMTAIENVAIGLHRTPEYSMIEAFLRLPKVKRKDKETNDKAMHFLEMVGLENYQNHKAGELPYGLQRKLEIARALSTSPQLMLLDEPAAGMNNDECLSLINFLKKLHRDLNITIIIIEHHIDIVLKLCERVCVLNLGSVLSQGSAAEVISNPAVIKAYLGERRRTNER